MAKKMKPQKNKVINDLTTLKKTTEISPDISRELVVLPPLKESMIPSSQNRSRMFDATTMDSTAVTIISDMKNVDYGRELISIIVDIDRVDSLMVLKDTYPVEFRKEGKEHVIDICRGIDSLETHTSMFIVLAMIQMGRILEGIYETLDRNRSIYSKWIKDNFGSQHLRYFQQSRQLLKMGETADRYSALGKNRLLQWDRLQDKDQYKEIMEQYPPPDITHDPQGERFKEHTDAAITLYNLKQGGIDFADFDQAYLLSCFNKHWIEQKTVKKIKDWLDKFPDPERKKEVFENFIMNKMVFPSEAEYQVVGNLQSLNTILSNLIKFYESYIQQGQTEWITGVNKSTFETARKIMKTLVKVIIPERIETSSPEIPPVTSPVVKKKKLPVKGKKTLPVKGKTKGVKK